MSAGESFFEYENFGEVLVVTPRDSIEKFRDSDIRDAYNETYRLLNDPGVQDLLVDFSNLKYFGSTFIGMLIRLARKARQGGGEAVLCNLTENMKGMMKTLMLLENTKTDFFWVPFDNRQAAIDGLAKADSSTPQQPAVDLAQSSAANPELGGGWARFKQG